MLGRVSTAVPSLRPEVERTRLDRWRDVLLGDPRGLRLWRWLAPALVTIVAGVLRLFDVGTPHALVFDETYYVKDSWSQWVLGYPSVWPENADASFVAGDTDIFTGVGSYVVHPPLGRILIGAGMALLGPDSATGWRLSAVVFGTATVLLVYLLAHNLTRSITFATVASGLIAIDGLSIVLSRTSLLDVFLTFFVVLAFWFVALDHKRTGDRLDAAMDELPGTTHNWGPLLWDRPWLLAAGAAAGAATAVKWSGLYLIAAIGIYVVVTDALARRRVGIVQWPMDAVRQGLISFVLIVPVSLVVYLTSWSGWLFTTGGYMRSSEALGTGLLSFLPVPLQNLWAYHESMYGFHVGLVTPHSYASPAWQWPLLIRPTSMYWHQDDFGVNGCALPNGCTEAISSNANPLIWWAGIAASVYLLVRFVLVRDWRHALVLTGLGATYLPWLLYPERTIFQFYTVAMVPFLVLAVAFALQDAVRGVWRLSRAHAQVIAVVFLVVCIGISAFWYPVWAGLPVSYEFWRLHNWLPSWI